MSENWKLRLVNFSLPCKSTTTTWRVLPPTILIQAGRGHAAKLSRLLGVFSFRGGDQGFAAASGPIERTFAWLNQFRRLRVRLGRTATRKSIPNQSVNRVLRRTFTLKM